MNKLNKSLVLQKKLKIIISKKLNFQNHDLNQFFVIITVYKRKKKLIQLFENGLKIKFKILHTATQSQSQPQSQ